MSGRVRYVENDCKSALNKVSGMTFRWSLNPYRGCVHGCHYCFARRYHAYYDLNAGDDFTGTVIVKTNVDRVLSEELSRRTWRREPVVVGTATDPYQPIEGRYGLTRRCLEAFARWRSPVGVVTKGTLVVRDVDVLADLSRSSGSTVAITVTTMDEGLARRLEPGTPPPRQRLKALERLTTAGVTAGVLMSPVVPGITDDEEGLTAVAREAANHGAKFLSGRIIYLKPGTKEHFLEFVHDQFPRLGPLYDRLYPGAFAPRAEQTRTITRMEELARAHGVVAGLSAAQNAGRPRQLELLPAAASSTA